MYDFRYRRYRCQVAVKVKCFFVRECHIIPMHHEFHSDSGITIVALIFRHKIRLRMRE